ncbi:DNA polymerase III subunit delta [invertebrate metagenome]|uniref:DNA polymerase III subunit delta n=1 Tax=invertebrate metagenome TaxID=1711999 RepID=A0A2H9TCT2_9ZZZZ
MKLASDKLASHLKKELAPVYIIGGAEPLVVMECADQVRHSACKAGFSEREVFYAESGFDWEDLALSLSSLSLFSNKRLFELRLNTKPGTEGAKVLEHYANHLSSDSILLIITGRLDSSATRTKWFKALDKAGVYIPIWPVEAASLTEWIVKRLQASHFNIAPDALAVLAERVEGNLLAAAQEIEKLKLLAAGKTIDLDAVGNSVSDSARYDVFDLSNSILKGDIPSCIRIFNGLKAEGIEASVVLWAIARDLRLLNRVGRAMAGKGRLEKVLEDMAHSMNMSPFLMKKRRRSIGQALHRHSEKSIRQMMVEAGEIDEIVKGVRNGDSWHSLMNLVLQLAGARPPIALSSVSF